VGTNSAPPDCFSTSFGFHIQSMCRGLLCVRATRFLHFNLKGAAPGSPFLPLTDFSIWVCVRNGIRSFFRGPIRLVFSAFFHSSRAVGLPFHFTVLRCCDELLSLISFEPYKCCDFSVLLFSRTFFYLPFILVPVPPTSPLNFSLDFPLCMTLAPAVRAHFEVPRSQAFSFPLASGGSPPPAEGSRPRCYCTDADCAFMLSQAFRRIFLKQNPGAANERAFLEPLLRCLV